MRRSAINRGHIDILTRVKLERRLGTVHFQMQARTGVAELGKLAKGQTACVEWDLCRVCFHYEDVVDMGSDCFECEGLGYVSGEFGDVALRDAG